MPSHAIVACPRHVICVFGPIHEPELGFEGADATSQLVRCLSQGPRRSLVMGVHRVIELQPLDPAGVQHHPHPARVRSNLRLTCSSHLSDCGKGAGAVRTSVGRSHRLWRQGRCLSVAPPRSGDRLAAKQLCRRQSSRQRQSIACQKHAREFCMLQPIEICSCQRPTDVCSGLRRDE